MSMDEFLDSHPLPANIKEVEYQSNGKNLHFLRSIDPTNIKKEVSDSLDCANSFWNLQDINNQLLKFIDGLMTESSTVDILYVLLMLFMSWYGFEAEC